MTNPVANEAKRQSVAIVGCTPEPLSNYLKALGVLRLVAEQLDPKVQGYWQHNQFYLVTNQTKADLSRFFLHDYQPTPVLSPWNGSTGFYPKDNTKTIDAVLTAATPRLETYQDTIREATKAVNKLGLEKQPQKADPMKRQLMAQLRNTWPDQAVKWLDACALVTADDLQLPPLLGTGGNDGNFEFGRTFIQRLQEVIDFQFGGPTAAAERLITACLWDETLPGLAFSGVVGQFSPISAGGANAGPGYFADPRVNPWDFILLLEGTLLFAAGATRRYEQARGGSLAYPFMVRPSAVGYGSAADADSARAELWAPLWQHPTGLKELQLLFNEGRAKVGIRAARNGVDFARAVSTLGTDRGIAEFVRYSFQERNGLSYFSIPLGHFRPQLNPQVNLLSELDDWLIRFERAAQDKDAPAAVKRTARQLNDSIISLSQGKATVLDVVIALGQVEAQLNRSLKFTLDKRVPPVPRLKTHWLKYCRQACENTRLFSLALALAATDIRQRLLRLRGTKRLEWTDTEDKYTTWQGGSFEDNLIHLLRRQEVEIQQASKAQAADLASPSDPQAESPQDPPPKVSLADLAWWIALDEPMADERLEKMVRGLCLIHIPPQKPHQYQSPIAVPMVYTLTALVQQPCLWARDENGVPEQKTLPRVPGILSRLAAGDALAATNLAIQRLRASGLRPALSTGCYWPPALTCRVAAALAFPVEDSELTRLLDNVQRWRDPAQRTKADPSAADPVLAD